MCRAAHGILCTLTVAGLLVLCGVAPAIAAPGGDTPAKVKPSSSNQVGVANQTPDPFTEALIESLELSGFEVSQGYPRLYTLDDCKSNTYPSLKNCFLANPAAPYVIPMVKPWPDEYVDPAMVNAIVEADPGFSATYRLDPREAIVVYGLMPPPGRYMGLQTWQFSEHGKWTPRDYEYWANQPDLPVPMQYLFDTVPPDDPKSHRLISLSALGDVVNNVVMERKSGNAFGTTRYFIISPSATTDDAVRRALQAQGVPDGHIFTEQIPDRDNLGPIGPLGMGRNAVDFFTAFRYAVPHPGYEYAAAQWRLHPPLTVLRVRAPDTLGPVRRYGALVFEPRGGSSEAYLAGDLEDLVAAVCADVSSHSNLTSTDCAEQPPATSFMPELVRDLGWTGPYCRNVGMDCQADQQEAALYFSSPRALGSGQVIAVIGTLATETGNAVYVGLSVNDASMMAGVPNGNILDSDLPGIKGLRGSADGYSATVNNTGKFFVHYFTKDCSVLANVTDWTENCTEVDGIQPAIGDPALRDQFIIALRNYIAAETRSGPDPDKLLTPRILTFMRP